MESGHVDEKGHIRAKLMGAQVFEKHRKVALEERAPGAPAPVTLGGAACAGELPDMKDPEEHGLPNMLGKGTSRRPHPRTEYHALDRVNYHEEPEHSSSHRRCSSSIRHNVTRDTQ